MSRANAELDAYLTTDSAGYRANYSCEDHIFVASEAIRQAECYGFPLWLAKLDVSKAFDTVSREALWRTLIESGLHSSYVFAIRRMYDAMKAAVNVNGVLSKAFDIQRGVRQGDPMSALLFSAVMEWALQQMVQDWEAQAFGLETEGDRLLTNLRFAYDMLLFAKSTKELLHMIQNTEDALSSVGLILNVEKTVVLSNRMPNTQHVVSLSGQQMNALCLGQSTKYLGARLGFGIESHEHVTARIDAAWASYTNIKSAPQNKNAIVLDKLRLFELVVTPAALYALGTCDLKDQDVTRLQTTQRRMLRKIVGRTKPPDRGGPREEWESWHRDNTANAERLLKQAGETLWKREAHGKVWDWAGHILKMKQNRLPRQTLNLRPIRSEKRPCQVHGLRISEIVTVLPGQIEAAREPGTGNRQWSHPILRYVRILNNHAATIPQIQGQRNRFHD